MKPVFDLPQFQFLGELGTGGTAKVCKVLTQEHKIAALKTILKSADITLDEFKKLALREKELLQDIDFPGIVKIYDVQTDSPSYICLEYCPGKTLETFNKIENLPTALNILSSIAVNLEFLNLKSIVHADLKPDNIFMPEDISLFTTEQLTFSKLSDFSLGKFEHEDNSIRAGVGTVGYMAPETIRDNIVTHKSDFFALGVIAYQILTGEHPFITDNADPLKINSKILEEEPLPLANYRNNIPEKLSNIVTSLLEKDTSKRPASAWDVCSMLRTAGATYPFEKVLNPKYAIDTRKSYKTNTEFIGNQKSNTETITNKNTAYLRLVLTDNFCKDNLVYNNKQFNFKNNPLTSSYCIRHAVKSFLKLSYTEKKSAIELSLQNNESNLISSLLPHLLKPQTIIRVTKRLALKSEKNNNYSSAAQLYVLSGNLLKAENAAYQAAMKYKNENKIDAAILLLNKVISFGTLLDRKIEVRSLYMVKGDLLKDIGEADRAEIIYNELIHLYQNQKEDELLAETYKDLGALYQMKKLPQMGIKSLEKALDIFKKLNNELETSKTYNNLGNIYTVKNDYTTALSYFRKALRIQRKLSADEKVASTLNNIGVIYGITSKLHKALRIFKLSLIINKEIGNRGEIARTLNNIGNCYEILGDVQQAIEMYQESLRNNKEIDSKKEVLFNLENLTAMTYSAGHLKESIIYLKEGITIATELQNQPHIGLFNLFMGAVLLRMGKIKEAQNSFLVVEKVLDEIEDDALLAQIYIEKVQLALHIGNKINASELLDNALSICNKIQDKTISIKAILLKISISNELSLMSEAEKIINDLELSKEKSILHTLQLNHYLTIDSSYDVEQSYKKLTDSVDISNEHIEQCSLLTTLAKYEQQQNNIEQAAIYINRSIQLAKSRGLVFDHFYALVLYGEILAQQKDFEKCYAVYKQALEIAKNIYNQLESDDDKQAFQNKKEFIFLISEIKKLSQIIGTKKEQV